MMNSLPASHCPSHSVKSLALFLCVCSFSVLFSSLPLPLGFALFFSFTGNTKKNISLTRFRMRLRRLSLKQSELNYMLVIMLAQT